MQSGPPPGRTPPAPAPRRSPTASTSPRPPSLDAARSALLARAFCYDDPGSYTAGVEAAFAAIGVDRRGRSA